MTYASIYCILCPSFHGATLLSLLLGNHSRMLSLGDTIPTAPFHSRCGCGQLMTDCEFWRDVRACVQSNDEREYVSTKPRMFASPMLNNAAVTLQGVLAARTGVTFQGNGFGRHFRNFLDVCHRHATFDVFIDGQKSLSHYLALKAAGFPVKGVIHLLRDPRAFVASGKRSDLVMTVEELARVWSRLHAATEIALRAAGERAYRVRYEDICAAPDAELTKMQAWMGVEPEPLVRPLDPNAHWTGNVSMIGFGGRIELKERWRSELSAEEQRRVVECTAARVRKYGYLS